MIPEHDDSYLCFKGTYSLTETQDKLPFLLLSKRLLITSEPIHKNTYPSNIYNILIAQVFKQLYHRNNLYPKHGYTLLALQAMLQKIVSELPIFEQLCTSEDNQTDIFEIHHSRVSF